MISKKVFIIILNWNGWRDSIECIRSCEKLVYPNFEIVLVDNGSKDDSVENLKATFHKLKIIENKDNLGFAGGNNEGIRYALENNAEYVWLLNNDTRVDPKALTELVHTIGFNEDTGMAGSKILLLKQPDTLHFAGGKINLENGLTTHVGAFEKDVGQYDNLSEVDYVTGCSLLVKREVIERIGLMPEAYFLYYEETDWCMLARGAGYKILMSQKSKVYHKVSGSIDYSSPEKEYYIVRNRLCFLKKYGQRIAWWNRLITDFRKACSFLKCGRFYHTKMIIWAYVHFIFKYLGPLNGLVKQTRLNNIAKTEFTAKNLPN